MQAKEPKAGESWSPIGKLIAEALEEHPRTAAGYLLMRAELQLSQRIFYACGRPVSPDGTVAPSYEIIRHDAFLFMHGTGYQFCGMPDEGLHSGILEHRATGKPGWADVRLSLAKDLMLAANRTGSGRPGPLPTAPLPPPVRVPKRETKPLARPRDKDLKHFIVGEVKKNGGIMPDIKRKLHPAAEAHFLPRLNVTRRHVERIVEEEYGPRSTGPRSTN